MAVSIVDLLEKIDVGQHERHGFAVTEGAGNLVLEKRLELAMVDEPREPVMGRQAFRLFDDPQAFDGQSGGGGQPRQQVAVGVGEGVPAQRLEEKRSYTFVNSDREREKRRKLFGVMFSRRIARFVMVRNEIPAQVHVFRIDEARQGLVGDREGEVFEPAGG